MHSKVAECDECGRLYDIIVNNQCPACSNVSTQADDSRYAVETESDDDTAAVTTEAKDGRSTGK